MTRERIEDMREVVLPFVKKRLLETNYEGLGKSDAKEFEREFNEILNLAIKALEQELRKGHWILKRTFSTKLHDEYLNEYKCSECYREIRCTESQLVNYPYCHCGARMIESQERNE